MNCSIIPGIPYRVTVNHTDEDKHDAFFHASSETKFNDGDVVFFVNNVQTGDNLWSLNKWLIFTNANGDIIVVDGLQVWFMLSVVDQSVSPERLKRFSMITDYTLTSMADVNLHHG